MDFAAFLHEDTGRRVVSDPPLSTDNVAVARNGCYGVLTAKTVHIYFPKFEYMSLYQVSWVEILDPLKEDISSIEGSVDPMKWTSDPPVNSQNETGLNFVAHEFLSTSQFDSSPWSVVLCTDGTLVVLKRNPFHNEPRLKVHRGGLRLCGLELVAKVDSQGKAYSMTTEKISSDRFIIYLAVDYEDKVVVELHQLDISVSGTVTISRVGSLSHPSRCDRIKCMVASEISMNRTLFCALHSSALVTFAVTDVPKAAPCTLSVPLPRTTVVHRFCRLRDRCVAFTSEGIIQLAELPQLAFSPSPVGADLVAVCALPSGAALLMCTAQKAIVAADSSLSTSFFPLGESRTLPAHRDVAEYCDCQGLGIDPLGMVYLFGLRIPAALGNSREIQLHAGVRSSRTAVLAVGPMHLRAEHFSAEHWLLHAHQVVYDIVQQRAQQPHKALSLFVLALLRGLDEVADFHSLKPPHKLPQDLVDFDRGTYVEKGKIEEDEEDDADEDVLVGDESDSEDDERVADAGPAPGSAVKKKKKQQPPTKSPKKASKSTADELGKFVMAKAYDCIRQHVAPNPVVMASHGLTYVHNGCIVALLMMAEGRAAVEAVELVKAMTPEQKDQRLLQPSAGVDRQLLHAELWRVWHYCTRTLLSVRLPPVPPALPELLEAVRARLLVHQAVVASCKLARSVETNELRLSDLKEWNVRALRHLVQVADRAAETLDIGHLTPALRAELSAAHIAPELCAICSSELTFDCQAPELSICSGCAVGVERCVFSFQLVTDLDGDLVRCPACAAHVNTAWFRRSEDVARVLYGDSADLLCPFCAVPFLRIA